MNGKLAVLLTALIVVPTNAASQELFSKPVARVLKVKGIVRIQDKEGEIRVAEVYGSVRGKERLIVDANAEITLGFRSDGHMERLARSCRATVTEKGIVAPFKVERIEPPRKHRRFVGDAVKKLRPFTREGTRLLKGPSGKISSHRDKPTSDGLLPITASTVLCPQPTLSWPPVPSATGYDVTLFQIDGPRVWTTITTETSLACIGDRRLRRGTKYTWDVTATLENQGGHRVYRGEFTVSTDEQRIQASQIEELIAGSEIEYLVLAATWYERNGLLAEAIVASRRLAELEPQSAAIHQALATLYDRAGRQREAQQARDRAAAIAPNGPDPLG